MVEVRKLITDCLTPSTTTLFVYLRKSSEGMQVIELFASSLRLLSQCTSKGAELEAEVLGGELYAT